MQDKNISISNSANSQIPKVEKNPQVELKINLKNDQNKAKRAKINKIVQIPRKVLIAILVFRYLVFRYLAILETWWFPLHFATKKFKKIY